MAFAVSSVAKTDNSKNAVDYDALNRYVVETANLEQQETLVGYVSAIVDLGEQEQEDSEVPFIGSEEDEAAEIEKHPATYFKDGINETTKKPQRLRCWPNRAIQSVTLAIDFPDIVVDKGQFFGESNPLPLRLWLGGKFYVKDAGMIVGRPTPLKINKSMGFFSFDKKHLFHKMAKDCKLIGSEEAFLPQQIDQLLGQAFQFSAQVFFKENKGKEYYTEYVKYVGGLGRGQTPPELLTQPILIQLNENNPEEYVKMLPSHIINTIQRAKNFEGSKLQKQLEERYAQKEEAEEAPPAPKAPAAKVAKPAVKKPVVEDEDLESPF
jgi:hypothetical protein